MNQIGKHIAATLKDLRQHRGWSLDKTAQMTGVSKAMLGQIEREESSPTIATLWKIASGFQVSFSSFLDDLPTTMPTMQIGTPVSFGSQEKMRILTLFPYDEQLGYEMFIIELLPHCEQKSSPHEPGVVEHIIVVVGILEILVNGTWQKLREGEGLRFNADQPHGYRNQTNSIARFHNVVHYPKKR